MRFALKALLRNSTWIMAQPGKWVRQEQAWDCQLGSCPNFSQGGFAD